MRTLGVVFIFMLSALNNVMNSSDSSCSDYLSTNIPILMIKKCIYNDIVWFYKLKKEEKTLTEDSYITVDDSDESVRIIPCGHIIEISPENDLFISPVFPYDLGLSNLYTDLDKVRIKAEVQRLSGGIYLIDHISNNIPEELCAFKIVGTKGRFRISKDRHRIRMENSVKEKFSKPNIVEQEAINSNYCPQKKNLWEKILLSSTSAIILTKDNRILVINGYRVIGKCEDTRLNNVEIGDLLISTDGEKISYDSIFALKFCHKLSYAKWAFIKPDGTIYKINMKK